MSDLAATNCGGCGGCGDNCNSIVWIIILLLLFDGNNGCGCNNGCGNGCNSFWIIILLFLCCGCGNGTTSSMALVADATADVDATVDADASNYLIWGCLKRQPLYINYYYVPSYIFHLFHIWYYLLQQVYCHCPEHPY